MKKTLLGFFGGLFVALIIYIVWAVYSINTFESSLPPGLRGPVEHPFVYAQKKIEKAIVDIEAGDKRLGCGIFGQSLSQLRMSAENEADKAYVIEAESKYASLCR